MVKDIDILMVYPRPTKDSPTKLTPLSILHAGMWFEQQGKIVEYFDQRFSETEELIELISRSKEIGISIMTGYQCFEADKILKLAKSVSPDIITSVGGPHVRLFPQEVLAEKYVDRIYIDRYYGVKLFPFTEKTKKIYQQSDLMYISSIGCPYACRFCSQSSEWIPKNKKKMEYELKILKEELDLEKIYFSDQNMVHSYRINNGVREQINKVSRIREIGELLNNLNLTWGGSMRCPDISYEMAETLVNSGCENLHLGAESGSDRILKRVIKKGHGVNEIKNSVLNLKNTGISVLYSFIAFMPGEKREDVFKTMDLIDWITEKDNSARVSIYNFTPYPGTELYDEYYKENPEQKEKNRRRSLKEWGEVKLMESPIYWIAGLNFRLDNTRNNFKGEDWFKIEPYVKLAKEKWQNRDINDFPCNEVSELVENQIKKNNKVN